MYMHVYLDQEILLAKDKQKWSNISRVSSISIQYTFNREI